MNFQGKKGGGRAIAKSSTGPPGPGVLREVSSPEAEVEK